MVSHEIHFKIMEVFKYKNNDFEIWNNFIKNSKNGTFLFDRNYMDYHRDRFEDYSVLVYEGISLIAVFPANIKDNLVFSHGGLTYGSIIINEKCSLRKFLEIFKSILSYFFNHNFKYIYYKDIPKFFVRSQSDEIDYGLFLVDAKINRVDTASVLTLNSNYKYSKGKKYEINKALKNDDLKIREDDNYENFWNNVLAQNLKDKYNQIPVHTVEEIQQLHFKFPENIKLYTVSFKDEIVAGTVLYITDTCVHAQYIAANDYGRNQSCLDLLFNDLIKKYSQVMPYFDFGICNENDGRYLNLGLLRWKEGFGGRTFAHKFYEIETKNHKALEPIITG